MRSSESVSQARSIASAALSGRCTRCSAAGKGSWCSEVHAQPAALINSLLPNGRTSALVRKHAWSCEGTVDAHGTTCAVLISSDVQGAGPCPLAVAVFAEDESID